MPVRVQYFTDPACAASWAAEPVVRKLMVEFGPDLSFRWVMGGLARELHDRDYDRLLREWLNAAAASGMPFDPRLWHEGPIRATYPACLALKAAAEQGEDHAGRYLRRLREGLMCFRRKLDSIEALVEEARAAGLDVARFRIDLGSNAIVEAFAADLEVARGVALPSARFGDEARVLGLDAPYDQWRQAAIAAGARPLDEPAPDVQAALRRFGRMATPEVAAVCELPGPRADAELWRLAVEWKAKPTRVLTGHLWEAA